MIIYIKVLEYLECEWHNISQNYYKLIDIIIVMNIMMASDYLKWSQYILTQMVHSPIIASTLW